MTTWSVADQVIAPVEKQVWSRPAPATAEAAQMRRVAISLAPFTLIVIARIVASAPSSQQGRGLGGAAGRDTPSPIGDLL